MKLKIDDNLFSWLLVVGIFTERYIEVSVITIICLLIFFYRHQLKISRVLVLLFVGVFAMSLFSVAFNKYSFVKPVQQYVILLYYSVCYYVIFSTILKNKSVSFIFDKYLAVANVVAIIGLVQFLVYLLSGYNICGFIYNTGRIPVVIPHIIRITSILDEPGYCALLLTPAFVYYLMGESEKVNHFWRKWIVYVTVFLTFSAATYLILFIAIVYFVFKKIRSRALKYMLTGLFLIFIYSASVHYSDNDSTTDGAFSALTSKLSETTGAFVDMDPYSFELLNLSSYSTMTNAWVALNAPTRLIGTGIGTHSQNYELLYKSDFEYYGLNKEDGYSLFNRIYSEFGILGIGLLLFFLYKNGNKKDMINVSVLFLLITLCIRGGNYVRYGTVFFFFLYYNTRSFKSIRNEKSSY